MIGASLNNGKFVQEFVSGSDSTLYIPFYISK
jgi:hypothetical protein